MKDIVIRDRSFYQKFFLIAAPIILQSCITIGINMLDTIMLGSFGEGYLSASSLSNQFFSLYQIICMGLGGGAAVMTAQAWGRKDPQSIRDTMSIMLWITLLIGIAFTVLTMAWPGAVMRLYTEDAEVLRDCIRYYQYLCYCFLFQGISLTLTQVLRTCGKVKVPMYASILGFFTNLFFNWVLIFGNLGFPRMEIEGAALGTLIARVAECLFIVIYVFCIDRDISFRLKEMKHIKREYLPAYQHYAVPVLCSDFLLGLGSNAVAIIMGHISSGFVAAFSISSVTQQMVNVFTSGVMFSSSTIVGNTLGQGDAERAYEEGRTFLAMSVILGIIGAAVIYLLKWNIIDYYNISDETKKIADSLMNGVSVILVFRMMCSVLTKGVLRGGGDTKFLLVADVLFLFCASIPLGALAGLVWHLSAFWTFFFLNIDNIIKSVWCLNRFTSKAWLHVIADESH